MAESNDADFYRSLLKLRSAALDRLVDRALSAEETVKVLRGAVSALATKDDRSSIEMAQKALEESYAHAKKEDIRLFVERDHWKVASMLNQRRVSNTLALVKEMQEQGDLSDEMAELLEASLTMEE